jgi:hypothetical protein
VSDDPIRRRLGVTPNPVEVHEFAPPTPKIDWRELNNHGFVAEAKIVALEKRVDELESLVASLISWVDFRFQNVRLPD